MTKTTTKKGKSLILLPSFSTQSWKFAQNAFLNTAKIQEIRLWTIFLNYASVKSCIVKNSKIFSGNNIFK